MNQPTLDSFVRNCYLHPRTDETLFEGHTDADGEMVMRARLDGYAIIPMEIYEGLAPKSPPTNPPTLPSST
jgi:hypothetical protein